MKSLKLVTKAISLLFRLFSSLQKIKSIKAIFTIRLLGCLIICLLRLNIVLNDLQINETTFYYIQHINTTANHIVSYVILLEAFPVVQKQTGQKNFLMTKAYSNAFMWAVTPKFGFLLFLSNSKHPFPYHYIQNYSILIIFRAKLICK